MQRAKTLVTLAEMNQGDNVIFNSSHAATVLIIRACKRSQPFALAHRNIVHSKGSLPNSAEAKNKDVQLPSFNVDKWETMK